MLERSLGGSIGHPGDRRGRLRWKPRLQAACGRRLSARDARRPVARRQGHRQMGPLEVGSTGNRSRVVEVLEKFQPTAVIHLASLTSISASVANPLLYYTNNVDHTATLLRAITDHEPVPFIYCSSASVYRQPGKSPASEDSPLAPISPYG